MTFTQSQVSLPPKRYFWRRVLAFLIDQFVIGIIVSLPAVMIWPITIGIAFGPNIDLGKCVEEHGRADVVQAMGVVDGGQVMSLACSKHDLLHGDVVDIFAVAANPGKDFVVPVFGFFKQDASGLHPINLAPLLLLPSMLGALALPAGFALFSAYGRQPLCKRLMGLRVVRTDESFPLFKQAAIREYWKFLPYLLMTLAMFIVLSVMLGAIVQGVIGAIVQQDFGRMALFAAIIPLSQLPNVIWLVGPFLFWNGQSWHDRLAGTKVVRT